MVAGSNPVGPTFFNFERKTISFRTNIIDIIGRDGEMKRYSLVSNRQAVAGVIEALLIVAMIATIIGTIQVVYIPEIMEQREADHMDEVSNQFSHMKAMIDIQTATESNTPIFSIVTLGSKELPYFVTVGASGQIEIVCTSNSRIEIDGVTTAASLTSIQYDAYNSYFPPGVNRQTYVLEGGGIFVDQPDGESVARVRPSLTFTEGDPLKIHFDLPVFLDVAGKNNTAGQGKCVIRTNYSHKDSADLFSVANYFRIYTKYPNAWNETFADLLGENAVVTKEDDYVQITEDSIDIDLEIRKIYVTAQIGPGWVI